jgi:hypothetical protein
LNDVSTFKDSPWFESIYTTALQLFPKAELDNYGAIAYTAMSDHRLPILTQKTINKANKKDDIVHRDIQDFFHMKENPNQPMIDYGILSF